MHYGMMLKSQSRLSYRLYLISFRYLPRVPMRSHVMSLLSKTTDVQSRLNIRNTNIQEENLQAQAGRVCRADHPTYSLNVCLCLIL